MSRQSTAAAAAALICALVVAAADGAVLAQPRPGRASGALLVRHRHIVTGCLKECGPSEQSCVTECQVCVEQLVCPSLLHRNCSSCLDSARAERRHFEGNSSRAASTGDSGGMPLVHEGIRQDLHEAELQSMQGRTQLRAARKGVLDAQRLAEWAVAERLEDTTKLRLKRQELDKHIMNKRRWMHRNEVGVNVTMKEVEAIEKDIRKKKRSLRRVEKRLEDLQAAGVGADIVRAASHGQEIITTTRVVRRIRWQLAQAEKALKKKQVELKKKEDDANWFRKGLAKRGVRMARDIKEQVRTLRQMKANEKGYRSNLRGAKEGYRGAIQEARNLTKKVRHLEEELEEHPMPDFGPPGFSGGQAADSGGGGAAAAGAAGSAEEE